VRVDLDPSGGGEAVMARQVGRRNCGAKAAVGRDKLRGISKQPSTAVLQGAPQVCRPCFYDTRVSRGGSTREPENPKVRGRDGIANQSGSVVSSGIHDIQQLLFLVDRRARPQITAGITSSAILYPLQSPANFFVIHGVSSSSSFSLRRSYRHGTSLSVRSFP
jgi:hypothetical protein